MRHYEIVLIAHPNRREQLETVLEKYKDLITKDGGSVHRSEYWGRLDLAYNINNFNRGLYFLLNIETSDKALSELKDAFKFNEHILRSLILKKESALTETSIFQENLNAASVETS